MLLVVKVIFHLHLFCVNALLKTLVLTEDYKAPFSRKLFLMFTIWLRLAWFMLILIIWGVCVPIWIALRFFRLD